MIQILIFMNSTEHCFEPSLTVFHRPLLNCHTHFTAPKVTRVLLLADLIATRGKAFCATTIGYSCVATPNGIILANSFYNITNVTLISFYDNCICHKSPSLVLLRLFLPFSISSSARVWQRK